MRGRTKTRKDKGRGGTHLPFPGEILYGKGEEDMEGGERRRGNMRKNTMKKEEKKDNNKRVEKKRGEEEERL